jgi:hypothetical protein
VDPCAERSNHKVSDGQVEQVIVEGGVHQQCSSRPVANLHRRRLKIHTGALYTTIQCLNVRKKLATGVKRTPFLLYIADKSNAGSFFIISEPEVSNFFLICNR